MVVAVMTTISEDCYEDEEDENIDPDTNTNYDSDPDQRASAVAVAAVSGGRPASEKLGMACFRMTLKNYCGDPNCE